MHNTSLQSTPRHTTPHHATPHHTTPHHTTPHHTTPHHTIPHHTTPHHTTPHHTTPTTRVETVYNRGCAVKVTTAMKDTMEAKDWTPELRVCCQPPGTLPSDTRLHRLLVALLGPSAGQRAPTRPTMGRPPACVPGPATERGGVGIHHRLAVRTTGGRVLAMGPGIASPPGRRLRTPPGQDSPSPPGRCARFSEEDGPPLAWQETPNTPWAGLPVPPRAGAPGSLTKMAPPWPGRRLRTPPGQDFPSPPGRCARFSEEDGPPLAWQETPNTP